MLDTILVQLAGTDRQIRQDAYSTLFSTWKAYGELPDGCVTREKTQKLLAIIRRELTCQREEPMEISDTNLMLHALKLQVTIVWNKALSVYLTDSYRSFLIDHSIRILEERKVSKAIILHYLRLLSTQDFSSRIMTTNRAVRLLEVLKDLHEHAKGNGVVSERLVVYHRILEQAKGAFRSRPSCWLSQLLSAMTCSIVDTRKRAIDLGHRLAVVLGSSPTVAVALRDLMLTVGDAGDVLSSIICKRLGKMMRTVDEARQVPQIWAIVMLLMRGLEQKLDEWRCLHDWLRIVQKCFNSSDTEVRTEANRAWSKLTCIARPYEGTKSFLTRLMPKPILVQLQRPSNEKQSKSTKNSAFAAYCNLLYYALRPQGSSEHNDVVWDEYITPALTPTFLSTEQNSDRACRILIALFWKEKIIPWRENRALDAAVVEPEDLPLLDRKWIRSRTDSILPVFELLFRSSCWGPAAYPDAAYIAVAWRNFARALGDACRKEVRSSTKTIEAVTHVLRFLIRICLQEAATTKGAGEEYVYRFHFICKSMLFEIGPTSFVDASVTKSNGGYSTAYTSTLDTKGRPLILDLLAAVQDLPQSSGDGAYYDMITDMLQLVSRARSSVSGRVHFYKQCAQHLLLDGSQDPHRRLTWKAISELLKVELAQPRLEMPDDTVSDEDITADVEKILEYGIPYQSCLGHGNCQLEAATSQARCQEDAQDGAQDLAPIKAVLPDHVPIEVCILDTDTEDALSNATHDSEIACPISGQSQTKIQAMQGSSACPNELNVDIAKAPPAAEREAGNGISSVEEPLPQPDTRLLAADGISNDERLETTSKQSPDEMRASDITFDMEMTGTPPQTDGSNEMPSESSFKRTTNVTPSSHEQVSLCNDDDDFWSASQLSQDLDRVASATSSQSREPHLDLTLSASIKRQRSPAPSPNSKRRKTTDDLVRIWKTPVSSSKTPKPHSSQPIYDCIEVESQASSQQSSRAASAVLQAPAVLQIPKRSRGRPRKRQSQCEMPDSTSGRNSFDNNEETERCEPAPKIEVRIPPEGGVRRELSQVTGGPGQSSGQPKDKGDRVLSIDTKLNRSSGPRLGDIESETGDKQNQIWRKETVELLQKALSCLRRTSMDRSELRAIDDLVFEIRTEAQNAAQRANKCGT